MKVKRRDVEVFSLSFMDCICCGFGAIILLMVLTDVSHPIVIERSPLSRSICTIAGVRSSSRSEAGLIE